MTPDDASRYSHVRRRVEATARRVDAVQQRHAVLGFPIAVLKKVGDDRCGREAAVIAYRGLFSLFPLLMLLSTTLGGVLEGNPRLQHRVLNSALARLPVIGTQLRENVHALKGSGVVLAVGVVGTLWGGLGVAQAVEAAMNTVWNVPRSQRPGFLARRVRAIGVLAVLGGAVLVSSLLVGYALSGIDTSPLHRAAAVVSASVVSLCVFLATFRILTARDLRWRDVIIGAAVATVGWQALQVFGGWYISRELDRATELYGFFGIVIGLLTFMSLAAVVLLVSAEVNVVRVNHLWPRTLVEPPISAIDELAYRRLTETQVRRPEQDVVVRFTTGPDDASATGEQ